MNHTAPLAVVTGANRGLGLETCRQLGARGYQVILTSRDPQLGRAAAESLRQTGLDVTYHPLDVDDPASIHALADYVRNDFGRLDVLVNNAGILIDGKESETQGASGVFQAEVETLRRTLETNTFGPLRLCQQLIPLMQGRGRVVNVSSGMGQLSEMNGGYPGYRISKVALNALTRIFADELQGTQVKINSVCPGWVRTALGGSGAERSVEEGADTIVWLATLPDDGPSGGFFRDRQVIPW